MNVTCPEFPMMLKDEDCFALEKPLVKALVCTSQSKNVLKAR